MTTTIKITELTDIGANLAGTTLVPVVNMAGTPTTERANVNNIANYVLNKGVGANLGAVGDITITGGTSGQKLTTDGAGNLSWTNDANSSYGNSNVATFLASYGSNTITTTGNITAGNITASTRANLGAVGNVKITGGTDGYVLQTDGTGNLSWTAQTGGSGNATPAGANTQIQFNDAGSFGGNSGFTFNKTTGILASPFLAGNGNGLSNIQGANVSGAVSYATTANAVAGANVSGAVTYATTANSVAAANVSGLGNLALLSKDGNASNILYGNGVFASIPNPFNQDLNTTDNVQFANVTSTEAVKFSNSGNIVGALGYAPTYVSIEGYGSNAVNITANDTYTWSFGNTGDLTVPGNILSTQSSNLIIGSSYSVKIVGDNGDNNLTWTFDGSSGELQLPFGAIIDPSDNNFEVRGIQNVNFEANATFNIYTDTSNNGWQWQFGDDGNLTLPGNTFAVNYANGTPVSIGGGGNVSQLVNSGNLFVLDADGNVTFEGSVAGQGVDRGLVWDYGANANGVNSMVRQDMNGITVRAWTEQGGGANGYSAPVRIVTNQNATEKVWNFDGSGNLTLPGNLNIPTGNIVSNIVAPAFNLGITGINSTGNANVTITIAGEVFEGNVSGQVTISNVNAPAQANGDWWYQASDFDQFQLFTDSSLTTPVDGSSWPGYAGPGGDAVGTGSYSNLSIQGGNVSINSNDNTWVFDTTGDINIPAGAGSFTSGRIQSANGYPTLLGYGTNGTGGPELNWAYTNNPDAIGNANVMRNTLYINDGGLYVGMNENGFDLANNYSGSWRFTPNGTTIFPTLDVDLHNGGVQSGQVLQFGNSSQQAIITGPAPEANVNAQRLIVQGQRGNGQNSEGGDVYFWAGDADTYGGDIKIYAGDADNVSAGYGGYVNIDGGDGFDQGGQIALTGGQGTGGPGGYVDIYAGQGTSQGGNLTLGAGYGASGSGGAVSIIGGGSGNGLAEYGNVNISAGASSWTFDNTGNLTLPTNSFKVNYANGTQVSIGGGSGNTGNVTFDNVTVQGVNGLNLSAGSDFTANLAYLQVRAGDVASHIHLDTGNNEAYDQYFGNDSKFVKLGLGIAGNVSIGTYQDGGVGQFEWTFDSNGNLILAGGNSVIQSIANSSLDPLNPNVSTMVLTPDPGYSSQSLVLDPTSPGHIHLRAPSQSGNIDIPAANIFLGGEDTSFEVTVGANNYAMIHSGGNTWTFDNTGNVTVPGSIVYSSNVYTTVGFTLSTLNDIGGQVDYGNHTVGYAADNNGTSALYARDSAGQGNHNAVIVANGVSGTALIRTSNEALTNYDWVFESAGNLTLPTISLGSGIDEQAVVSSQRKLIPPFRYSAVIDGDTPTVVYNATDVNTTSMKVTMQVQHAGLGMEFFEVFATFTGSDTYYTVGNRVSPTTIAPSTVVVGLGTGSTMKITVEINSGATTSWVTYDAVEFGIAVD